MPYDNKESRTVVFYFLKLVSKMNISLLKCWCFLQKDSRLKPGDHFILKLKTIDNANIWFKMETKKINQSN